MVPTMENLPLPEIEDKHHPNTKAPEEGVYLRTLVNDDARRRGSHGGFDPLSDIIKDDSNVFNSPEWAV